KFSCEFTGLILDLSRDGVPHVPPEHFSFATFNSPDRESALKSELVALQGIAGLNNRERGALEELIWHSLVRPSDTYIQELLKQLDSDIRSNTPALKFAVIERLQKESGASDVHLSDLKIQVEEVKERVFYIKSPLVSIRVFAGKNTFDSKSSSDSCCQS